MTVFISPVFRATSTSNAVLSGAKWNFYYSGTSSLAPVYTTDDRTTTHASPVVADSGGLFPPIYLDPTISYRAVLTTSSNALVQEFDPYFVDAGPASTISPVDFGAAGDGTTDDIAAVSAALSYAFAKGIAVDGANTLFAVGGNLAFADLNHPYIRRLSLKQLDPIVGRTTLRFERCEGIQIDNLYVDVGSAAAVGDMNSTLGLVVDGGADHRLSNVVATGDGILSYIGIWNTTNSICSNFIVRDGQYDSPAAADDIVQGIWLLGNADCSLVNPIVARLGGNASSSYPYRYTRGICLSDNLRCAIWNPIVRDVDQGIDISGSEGNVHCQVEGGHTYQCTTAGVKLANSAVGCLVRGHTAERAGQYAFGVGGPSEPNLLNKTADIDLVDCLAVDVGFNRFPQPHRGFDVHIETNDTDYPRAVRMTNCHVIDRQGLKLSLPPAQGATSASLVSAFAGETGSYYAVFDTGEIQTVSLTNSSTSVVWSGGLASAASEAFLYMPTTDAGFYTDVNPKQRPANGFARPLTVTARDCTVDVLGLANSSKFVGIHHPYFTVEGGGGGDAISSGTWVTLEMPGAEYADPSGLHNPSNAGDLVTIKEPGSYIFKAQTAFPASSGGALRGVRVTVNGTVADAKYVAPHPTQKTFVSGTFIRFCNSGDLVRVQAYQDSGGVLTINRTDTVLAGAKVN